MTWFSRSVCVLCLAVYWISYGELISWKLPLAGLFLFFLAWKRPTIAIQVFIASYPALLYFNQYPRYSFSSVTFLVITLVLGLSLRISTESWLPMSVIAFYFFATLVRYRPDPGSILAGVWTTDQANPSLFVGVCVMWMAGAILFDFLRRMPSGHLYWVLLAQGALFTSMCIVNIWFRHKTVLLYEFLFGDVHAFAAYLVLQIALLVGLCWRERTFSRCIAASVLFLLNSLLLVASYSRSGLVSYFVVLSICLVYCVVGWIMGRQWQKIAVALPFIVALLIGAAYAPVYTNFDPVALKRDFVPRLEYIRNIFRERTQMISPTALYIQRVRNWAVPVAMLRDHPILGIGVGHFYQTSAEYSKKVAPDLYWQYPENAHNYYLQIAAETGVSGMLLLTAFLMWVLWAHWTATNPMKFSSGLGVLGLMIFSMAQHPLLVDRLFFVFIMVCALMAGNETGPATLTNENTRTPAPTSSPETAIV
jgi:O-antigen ligase